MMRKFIRSMIDAWSTLITLGKTYRLEYRVYKNESDIAKIIESDNGRDKELQLTNDRVDLMQESFGKIEAFRQEVRILMQFGKSINETKFNEAKTLVVSSTKKEKAKIEAKAIKNARSYIIKKGYDIDDALDYLMQKARRAQEKSAKKAL